MFRNYFKITIRNLFKHGFYSLLNIGGLSIGIAFVLLTFGFVWRELQVNRNLRNVDNQYILMSRWSEANMGNDFTTLGQLAKALKDRYPNLVENYYRFDGITTNVSKDSHVFREDIQIGDSTFLQMYGFPLLDGNPSTAFERPFSVVVSQEVAKKYFGKTDVVGQSLMIQNFSGQKQPFNITGVLGSNEESSIIQINGSKPCGMYTSLSSLDFFGRNMNWQNNAIISFVELKKGVAPAALNEPMRQLITKNTNNETTIKLQPYLSPLKSYYLNSGNGVNKKMLFAVITIAAFIMLMAITNFVNLAVSRSTGRMKEIGLRKVLGGQKRQLIFQFLSESFLFVAVSTFFALLLYGLTRGFFGHIVGKEIPSMDAYPVYYIGFLFLFIVVVGLLAGLYPAFIMSSFRPAESIKGKMSGIKENKYLRLGLVTLQFAITTIVLINVWIVGKQVSHLLNSNLGFDKDYIVAAQLPRDWTPSGVQKMENFCQQFLQLPQIQDVSLSYEIPNGNNGGEAPLYKFGSDSTTAISSSVLLTDAHFASVYRIALSAGNFFSSTSKDSGNIVLNETAVHSLGWVNTDDAVGKQVRVHSDPTIFTVKGVVKDFNFGSMQQKIPPILFFDNQNVPIYRYFSFKLKPGNLLEGVNAIEQKWRVLMPDAAFEYSFMDDQLKNMYNKELQFKNATYTALFLALIMVALGIIGMVSMSIQKRVKEVAVRKVLGASVRDILQLFVQEYLMILLIGNIVAIPIAFYIGHNWLSNYAYHISLTIVPFILAVLLVSVFTISIIVMQTSKAALANPAKNLRSE